MRRGVPAERRHLEERGERRDALPRRRCADKTGLGICTTTTPDVAPPTPLFVSCTPKSKETSDNPNFRPLRGNAETLMLGSVHAACRKGSEGADALGGQPMVGPPSQERCCLRPCERTDQTRRLGKPASLGRPRFIFTASIVHRDARSWFLCPERHAATVPLPSQCMLVNPGSSQVN